MEKLIELIESSDMTIFNKAVAKGFVDRHADSDKERSEMFKLITSRSNAKVNDIIFHNDEVIFFTENKSESEECVRFLAKDKDTGTWVVSYILSPNFEESFIVYLELKYLGSYNRAAPLIVRMLGMPAHPEI